MYANKLNERIDNNINVCQMLMLSHAELGSISNNLMDLTHKKQLKIEKKNMMKKNRLRKFNF